MLFLTLENIIYMDGIVNSRLRLESNSWVHLQDSDGSINIEKMK
jgi:hypothetical protein